MEIRFKAILPEDITQRERDALVDQLLGDMSAEQIAKVVHRKCGAPIIPIISRIDQEGC